MSYRRQMQVERLTEVISDHARCDEWGGPDWHCKAEDCDGQGVSYEDYAEHLANAILDETPEGIV